MGLGFRYKHRFSTLTSEGREKEYARIYVVNKTVVYWMVISLVKLVAISFTHSYINCDGELIETVGIVDMNNVCKLWYLGNYYTFTEIKWKNEVVGSLKPHIGNAPFLKRRISYMCNRKIHTSQSFLYWRERPYQNDSTTSNMLSRVKDFQDQLVLSWRTTLESWILFFLLPETSMDMALKWSTDSPNRFGVQG